jgi:predicted metal-dependent phosphotriesterase family hydrolase
MAPEEVGFALAHEHIYAAFGSATGDPDLEFTCAEEITADLIEARQNGVKTIVEVSTEDMGGSAERTADVARRAGLVAVKSTGWFRSPTADHLASGRPTGELARRLVSDITTGFAGSRLQAGLLGEVGLSGTTPTSCERRLLEATAEAARETGAGIALHTDDRRNGQALVEFMLARGVLSTRLMVGHARASDPLSWHSELVSAGIVVAFDQVGHPHRDSITCIAERVEGLTNANRQARLVLSADLGRRSRLRAFGGTGYTKPLLALLAVLSARGVGGAVLARLTGGTAADFLAMPVSS